MYSRTYNPGSKRVNLAAFFEKRAKIDVRKSVGTSRKRLDNNKS